MPITATMRKMNTLYWFFCRFALCSERISPARRARVRSDIFAEVISREAEFDFDLEERELFCFFEVFELTVLRLPLTGFIAPVDTRELPCEPRELLFEDLVEETGASPEALFACALRLLVESEESNFGSKRNAIPLLNAVPRQMNERKHILSTRRTGIYNEIGMLGGNLGVAAARTRYAAFFYEYPRRLVRRVLENAATAARRKRLSLFASVELFLHAFVDELFVVRFQA